MMLKRVDDGGFQPINRGYNSVFRLNRLSLGLVASSVAMPVPALAEGSFSDAQKKELHSIIRDYMLENPELLAARKRVFRRPQTDFADFADYVDVVTGSEVVGLIPLEAMLAAGRFYLERQLKSPGVPEEQIVETAIQSIPTCVEKLRARSAMTITAPLRTPTRRRSRPA